MKNKPNVKVMVKEIESPRRNEFNNNSIRIQPHVDIPPNRQSSANFDSENESVNNADNGGNSRL